MDFLFLEFLKHKTNGHVCWGCWRDILVLSYLLLNVICHIQKFSTSDYHQIVAM